MNKTQGLNIGQPCKDMRFWATTVRRWLAPFDATQLVQHGIGTPLSERHQRIHQREIENHQLRGYVETKKRVGLLRLRTQMRYVLISGRNVSMTLLHLTS